MKKPSESKTLRTASSRGWVLTFFLCFFVLLSSGRLGSNDAGGQLAAATLLATTGTLGTANSAATLGWVPSPNGRVYEAHDLGALVLMLPNAWVATKLSHASPDELFKAPPLLAKVGTALTYAVVAAIGCYFLFLLFSEYAEGKYAFVLSLLFAAGTYFLPYAKVTWDVLPATAMMCVFLYYANATLRVDARASAFAAAGLALALVCSFRYSLAPFMAISLALMAWPRRAQWPKYVLLGATFLVLMVPTFIYNQVRTGSPFRPATATPFYMNGNNSLEGNILHGLPGLFFSGNHGLLLYAPTLLLLLGLPFIWRRLPPTQRSLIAASMVGSVLYILLIAKMVNWGAFGWGPRYLLPILPIWFVAAAPVLVELRKRARYAAAAVIVAAAALNVAPATTNWGVVGAEYPGADVSETATPYAWQGIWDGFGQGIHGQMLHFAKSDPQISEQDLARRFPDIWTARLIEKSRVGGIAGWSIMFALICGMALSWHRITRGDSRKAYSVPTPV
ncbi:hypothetical protein [Paraburkholderia sp. DHOC27]|uniref:hypothetical protein n=1 Tax=Paraburkholderia sp. DHOC27 TaxID=2303330 RepID=UPI000E3C2933|nr:hypothetical protein [Paraburkholderia sp. DHOC27]RFU47453.1 hypothetical protein D0B32_15190 [Paraburkholderia sp. DHOC27]